MKSHSSTEKLENYKQVQSWLYLLYLQYYWLSAWVDWWISIFSTVISQEFSNLPARQICWQERLFKLAGEVFSKKSLPLKKNHYQFFSKSLPIFQKITSVPMILKKITTKSLLYDYVEEVRSDFFFQKILGSDFFGARKNGSDFLALLKKFENPWTSHLYSEKLNSYPRNSAISRVWILTSHLMISFSEIFGFFSTTFPSNVSDSNLYICLSSVFLFLYRL